ncbi:hypothetical protein ABZW18_19445 [Streptomyces sp. NPDC004647]|uniref:hypothetical protein n=1 Tax=Streptomyces sp. NPDC004647 TaxID=3154671 RepID=UPI0033B8FB3B
MARRRAIPDGLAALSAVLFAVLMLCQVAVYPAEATDSRPGGTSNEADALSPDPPWDEPLPLDGPLPYGSGSRSPYPTVHAPADIGYPFTSPAGDGGSAASHIRPLPVAHGPPHGLRRQNPAALTAVLQVFRF